MQQQHNNSSSYSSSSKLPWGTQTASLLPPLSVKVPPQHQHGYQGEGNISQQVVFCLEISVVRILKWSKC